MAWSVTGLATPCPASAQLAEPGGTSLPSGEAQAREAEQATPIVVIGRSPARPACQEDQPACFADRLEEAALAALAEQPDPRDQVPDATSAPVAIGVGSVAGSSQRLGGDLRGATELPRRAPAPVFQPIRSQP